MNLLRCFLSFSRAQLTKEKAKRQAEVVKIQQSLQSRLPSSEPTAQPIRSTQESKRVSFQSPEPFGSSTSASPAITAIASQHPFFIRALETVRSWATPDTHQHLRHSGSSVQSLHPASAQPPTESATLDPILPAIHSNDQDALRQSIFLAQIQKMFACFAFVADLRPAC
eukprot:m.103103 g.103103  ORF g.103103 m.103103 type:complete len:169 (+) comp51554_c0_seq1:1015-1521(+)